MDPIVITNFGGRLTRKLNGDMNSGFAKFATSWGYDPFSKPDNLTWLETPVDITGPINNMPLAAEHRLIGNSNNVFILDQGKHLYQIQSTSNGNPNLDSVIGVSSVSAGNVSYLFGSSLRFYGSVVGGAGGSDPFLYVSNDTGVNRIKTDGSAEAIVIAGSNKLVANQYHSLGDFIGKLIVGNGNTVAAIDSTGTSTSSVIGTGLGNYLSELNPPLGVDYRVQDLDISIDGNNLLISGSKIPTERLDTVGNDGQESSSADSAIFGWNGSDQTVTSENTITSYGVTANQTFLGNSMIFSNDSFGSSISDGTNKLLTLPNNKSPLPNATDVNGNFLVWACPEVSSDGTVRYASLYYFGSLDSENSPGLYRVMRWTTTQSSAQVFQVPLCLFVNSKYQTLNTSYAIVTASYGKHYIGVTSVNTSGSYQSYLLRFLITPTGSGAPQAGVYETQTQLFSKKVTTKQIRVYTEPTVSGNGFQLDLIGSDGNVLSNGTGTYTFAAGTDPTLLQGALQRIDFNLKAAPTYAIGARITNTGSTNMTIKKIEIDPEPAGK